MQFRLWNELLELVRKTGDTCILADGERTFVLMDIRKYHILILERELSRVHLTDSGLIDKINREIALWHETQKDVFIETQNNSSTLPSTFSSSFFNEDGVTESQR